MPSLAVFNGHAFAGGLILGLMHDQRIMTSEKKRGVCLSEINVGLTLGPVYTSICKSTMKPKSFREMVLGVQWDAEQALKGEVIDGIFNGVEDCEKQIKAFAAKFAAVGAMREGIKRNKEFYFKHTVHDLEKTTFNPKELVIGSQGKP